MNRIALLRSIVFAAAAPAAIAACGGSTDADSSAGTAGSNAAGSGTSGSGTAGTGTGGTTSHPCASPQPILVKGMETGVETCADGSLHKKTGQACPMLLPSGCEGPMPGSCTSSAECKDAPNGYCGLSNVFGTMQCACQYACFTDADCTMGNVCLCGTPAGRCVPGTCTKDADCGAGQICSTFDQSKGCGQTQTACRTPKDECGGDLDCGAMGSGMFCTPDDQGVRRCVPGGCAVGRPLIVERAVIVAALVASSGWC